MGQREGIKRGRYNGGGVYQDKDDDGGVKNGTLNIAVLVKDTPHGFFETINHTNPLHLRDDYIIWWKKV
jgi:hypothetical protein